MSAKIQHNSKSFEGTAIMGPAEKMEVKFFLRLSLLIMPRKRTGQIVFLREKVTYLNFLPLGPRREQGKPEIMNTIFWLVLL